MPGGMGKRHRNCHRCQVAWGIAVPIARWRGAGQEAGENSPISKHDFQSPLPGGVGHPPARWRGMSLGDKVAAIAAPGFAAPTARWRGASPCTVAGDGQTPPQLPPLPGGVGQCGPHCQVAWGIPLHGGGGWVLGLKPPRSPPPGFAAPTARWRGASPCQEAGDGCRGPGRVSRIPLPGGGGWACPAGNSRHLGVETRQDVLLRAPLHWDHRLGICTRPPTSARSSSRATSRSGARVRLVEEPPPQPLGLRFPRTRSSPFLARRG